MADAKAKSMTKSAVLQELSTKSGLKKSEVSKVLEALTTLIQDQLGKKGPGVFTIPGLFKLTKRIKAATKAGMRMNPFTKSMQMMPAKPAKTTIRARALKGLTDSLK
jgi:nucleoid DNA-binding protein